MKGHFQVISFYVRLQPGILLQTGSTEQSDLIEIKFQHFVKAYLLTFILSVV